MRKLRIGQIAPLNVPIPPKKYGGTERIINALCRGLSNRGHKIFLFAAADAKTGGKIIPIIPKSLWTNKIKEATPYYSYEMNVILQKSPGLKLDILHDHLGPFSLALYGGLNIPILHTLHVPINKDRAWAYRKLNSKLISISNNQRKNAPRLNYVATIYNGTDTNLFQFNPNPKDYLLFLGELVERKGVREAILAAKKLKLKLVIAGRVPLQTQRKDYSFFQKYVKPKLNRGRIEYAGEVAKEKVSKLYRDAKATLFPIRWEEPFGLVMIESMSCGTPIIAFAKGSVPEIIKDGETGFIVNFSLSDIRGNWIIKKTGIEGLCKAVDRIYAMPEKEYRQMRENCRKRAEKNFAIKRMVDEYEKVYYKILRK
ncbi:glycosyltransferase family 4 protein [Patescibacteria group bacterium]|nr:glycosyltransferase family 4 protein [Patescibacteria group bacterium]MBU4367710.1 glycosyltransferase family 4 protein [Patescibacteria group bacterium]MBU4461840.1 glycosyltransferase family 4 protein [Patescibacteria group bacterium]MCG2700029.1 glycosyltransferase family 4 protein [Candidatus Parcubacteria bacterium]